MQKLDISQLMQLSEYLEHQSWLVTLIEMNRTGQMEKFLEFIGKKELLEQTLQNNKKSKEK